MEKARAEGSAKSKSKKSKKGGKKGGKSSNNNNNNNNNKTESSFVNADDNDNERNLPLPPPSVQSPSQDTAQAEGEGETDDNRGRTRSDSIGPEIRKARIIARLDSIDSSAQSGDKSAATPDSDPSPVSTTPPAIPTDGQVSGTSASPERRPGAPNLQMFASSYLKDVQVKDPNRAIEVAERLAQRERDNERDGKLGVIGNMISKDKKAILTSSSSLADNTTDFDTSSDIMCSMYSDTNSFYSDNDEVIEEEVRPSSYSKSPKQLSFANGRPPPNVPTLQLEVLRSPRGERDRVKAPDPDKAMVTLTEGENAFSPRSISESEFST
jgi:hypothetical protein